MGFIFGAVDTRKLQPDRAMPKRCRWPQMCMYFSPSTQTCDYLDIVGTRRPCPPGDKCTVKKTGKKELRKSPWNDNMMTIRKNRPPKKSKLEGNKQAEELYAGGAGDAAIAEACGVSKSTVVRWRTSTGRVSNKPQGRPAKEE